MFYPLSGYVSCSFQGFDTMRSGYTERGEKTYTLDDTARSATLDMRNRGRNRGGSVPFAENEDVDPAYYPREGEVRRAYVIAYVFKFDILYASRI